MGKEVAVIYGSLPSGTKLTQAEKFIDPQHACSVGGDGREWEQREGDSHSDHFAKIQFANGFATTMRLKDLAPRSDVSICRVYSSSWPSPNSRSDWNVRLPLTQRHPIEFDGSSSSVCRRLTIPSASCAILKTSTSWPRWSSTYGCLCGPVTSSAGRPSTARTLSLADCFFKFTRQ